ATPRPPCRHHVGHPESGCSRDLPLPRPRAGVDGRNCPTVATSLVEGANDRERAAVLQPTACGRRPPHQLRNRHAAALPAVPPTERPLHVSVRLRLDHRETFDPILSVRKGILTCETRSKCARFRSTPSPTPANSPSSSTTG